jgi:hypothetical protein
MSTLVRRQQAIQPDGTGPGMDEYRLPGMLEGCVFDWPTGRRRRLSEGGSGRCAPTRAGRTNGHATSDRGHATTTRIVHYAAAFGGLRIAGAHEDETCAE